MNMKFFTSLISIWIITVSCNNDNKASDFDQYILHSSEYQVYRLRELNNELYNHVIDSDSVLRKMVSSTLHKLYQLQEFAIESSGGYQGKMKDRMKVVNKFSEHPSKLLRENSLSITVEYLNQIPTYLSNKGFKAFPIALNPNDDPYFKEVGDERDWFDIAFQDQNVIHNLIVIENLKIEILLRERKYLQSSLD